MYKLVLLLLLACCPGFIYAQQAADTASKISNSAKAEDPSQFFTRIEVFNELQRYSNKQDFYVNQTVVRTIVKIGKKFTTRVDLPYINNTINAPAHYKTSGIGDISFRLLGFKFLESKFSAFTASMEISLNTAQSPILGTGKNLLIPVVSYSKVIPKRKLLLSVVLQQTNSISGDEERSDISFTKLQFLAVKTLSKRTWVVLGPEWFLDYINGGLSMNLRSRLGYVLTPRINAWVTPSAGVFGDFTGRYQWSLDFGARYFLFKEMSLKKKNSS